MLPAWVGKERTELEATGWVPGAILLTDEPVPDEPEKPAVIPLDIEQPKPEEIAEDIIANDIPLEAARRIRASKGTTLFGGGIVPVCAIPYCDTV